MIGDDPNGVLSNLFPYISQVAAGRLTVLQVNGYPARDGTGIRDYMHVMDLAAGHVAALKAIQSKRRIRVWIHGTGKGCGVFEVVSAFEQVIGEEIPYGLSGRR